MEEEKRPPWRPTTYKPEYCQKVIELGELGASVVEMATALGAARSTMEEEWTKANPDFSEALTYARQLSQVWWERKGQDNLIMAAGQTFQGNVWSRSMAARFPNDWREQTRVEQTGVKDGPPIKHNMGFDLSKATPEQLRAMVSGLGLGMNEDSADSDRSSE